MWIANSVRKSLLSSIKVPVAIVNSDAFNKRNKNIKSKQEESKSNNDFNGNEMHQKLAELGRQNEIFWNISSIGEDLQGKDENKSTFSTNTQAYSKTIMVSTCFASISFVEILMCKCLYTLPLNVFNTYYKDLLKFHIKYESN